MLVISRRLREKLWIGGVCIQVVDIDRGRIRLGIEAKREILVVREELLPPAEAEKMLREIREGNAQVRAE